MPPPEPMLLSSLSSSNSPTQETKLTGDKNHVTTMASNVTEITTSHLLQDSARPSDISSLGTKSKRKRSPEKPSVVDTMTTNLDARSELAKEKIRFLQLENNRRRENHHRIMWEAAVETQRLLRNDLREPKLTEEEKLSLLNDMKALNTLKNKLVMELGMHDAD